MSTPIHAILTGTFTSAGTARFISLPSGYDSFELINITDIGSAAANTNVMRAKGYSSLPAGSAYLSLKTNGAASVAIETMTLTNGLTFYADTGNVANGAPVAVTSVTQAAGAVVSSASAAAVGDIVRVYGVTAMQQISGIDFTVTAVNPGVTQTLGYLNSAAFVAAGTAGFIRILGPLGRFYPRTRTITGITAANPAVITMSVAHGYIVGEKVRIVVPAEYGMTQINGLSATITAINTGTNTITTDIDASTFTAFAYPTSAIAAAGVSQALVVPLGEAASGAYANLLDDAMTNQSFTGVLIGTTVQTTGVLYQWIARKGLSI
jgi:hypothetical protein